MIGRRLRNLISLFALKIDRIAEQNDQLIKQQDELEWASVFHDTIRGREWLQVLSFSPGRWAANYSFLYILVKILSDCKPDKIIEFGLGESSKIISAYLDNELTESSHLIIEHNESWIEEFKKRSFLAERSSILHLPLTVNNVGGFDVNCYSLIKEKVEGTFNLYVVDGPRGSDRYARHDICLLADRLTINDEFIIIMDDYERGGERETAEELEKMFLQKGILVHSGIYMGAKYQMVFATKKYEFIVSQ